MKEITGYPSIDKPWIKYYKEDSKIELPQETIWSEIFQNERNKKRIALEYFGVKISYEKMRLEVDKCAAALLATGLKKGDVVNMCVSSCPEVIYIILACSKLGMMANFINPFFTKEQKADRLNDTNSEHLFVMDKMVPYIVGVIEKTKIKNIIIIPATNSLPLLSLKKDKMLKKIPYNYSLWREFISNGYDRNSITPIPYEKNMPLVMVYSSGTTGASKGIVLTNDSINATARMEYPVMGSEDPTTFLQIIPIWFSTGVSLSILCVLLFGWTAILEPQYSQENFAKAIKKYKPMGVLGTASLWDYAITSRELKRVDLSFLKMAFSGGEPLSVNMEKQINQFFRNHNCMCYLRKGYGQCELGGTVTLAPNECDNSGIENVGIPLPGVTISSFDMDNDNEVKYGNLGEIRVISPARMLHYYMRPDATADFCYVDKTGKRWCCTGDIGYVANDGKVVILGRTSQSFVNEKGERVYLFKTKHKLLEIEEIRRCEIVNTIVDGKNTIAAHIIIKEGTSEKKVLMKANEKMLKLKPSERPKVFKFRTEFLLNAASGKCDLESLKKEKNGFVSPDGKSVEL